jgi:hypothetical protein
MQKFSILGWGNSCCQNLLSELNQLCTNDVRFPTIVLESHLVTNGAHCNLPSAHHNSVKNPLSTQNFNLLNSFLAE